MTDTQPRKALILLDYQVALCKDGPHMRMPPLVKQTQARGVIEHAAQVLEAARRAGPLVVHVRLAFESTYALRTNRHPRFDAYPNERAMLADSPESQIVDDLKPADNEPVIVKGCVDPFVGTPLSVLLAAEGIRHIIIGGVATNLVVESTARHACDAGLDVTVVDDMCASFDPAFHEFSMTKMMPLFGRVATSAEVVGELS